MTTSGSGVAIGDDLPQLVIESVDAEKMKTMAALLRDPNPIHLDPAVVDALGMGTKVVNQGPNNMAYVVNMLTAWAGGPGRLTKLRVRFLANVFAGDRLVAGGTVTGIDGDRVTCDVWLARNGTEPVLAGTAVVHRD